MAYLLGFNNNIRCIEIGTDSDVLNVGAGFNNNIRCIEIDIGSWSFTYDPGLITT